MCLAHVSREVRACFFRTRRLRTIRREIGRQVTAQLASTLILSRLDYCYAVLTGSSGSILAPLQRVLNAAARLVLELGPSDHVSAALHELHWLPIRERVDYKLYLQAKNVREGHTPEDMLKLFMATSDFPSKESLRSSNSGDFVVPATRLRLPCRCRCLESVEHDVKRVESTHVTSTFKRNMKKFPYDHSYIT